MYSQRSNCPEYVVLKVGALDYALGMQIAMNIWTSAAHFWVQVDPALGNHPQNRPA